MSADQFIAKMPKVEPYLHFEGALPKETLMLIADESNLVSTMKPREYNEVVGYINKPEPKKYDDIARILGGWLRIPEDLTRAVYDIGVALHRQNVRYAEVYVNPTIYIDAGMAFEQFLDAINDGRDRVLRAWQVRMDWVFSIMRDRPLRSDEVARLASSPSARKGNVKGIGLVGREDVQQPASSFIKAFQTAQKRELGTATHAKSQTNVQPLAEVLEALNPVCLLDVYHLSEEDVPLLLERALPIVVTPSRELRLGRIASLNAYPLRDWLSRGVSVALSSGMPALYRTTLTEEYALMAKHLGLTPEEVSQLAANAIEATFLSAEEKGALLQELVEYTLNAHDAS